MKRKRERERWREREGKGELKVFLDGVRGREAVMENKRDRGKERGRKREGEISPPRERTWSHVF